MNTPKAKPKPSKEVLDLVRAAKAKSKAQRNLKRNHSTSAPAPLEKRGFFVG